MLICTGYYGNRSNNAYQPPPIVQYRKAHVATHSATPHEIFLDQCLYSLTQLLLLLLELYLMARKLERKLAEETEGVGALAAVHMI